MHLLLVTQDFPPDVGGTQTYSAEIAAGFVRAGHEVTVVCPDRPAAASVDGNVPYRVVRVQASSDAFPIRAFPTVRRVLRTGAVDRVYAVSWAAAIPVVLAAATGVRAPLIMAVHGRELLLDAFGAGLRGRLYNALRRRVVRSARLLLPVSRYTASLLEPFGVSADRVVVVNNGTDPRVFEPGDGTRIREQLAIGTKPMLLSVCRLVGRKGVDTVLRGLPNILRTHPDVVYVVAGEGPESGDLKSLALSLGVADHVQFIGRMPYTDLPALYAAASVFVLPARQAEPDVEGFGIVFLEANACGTAVLGARSGGVPDAIVHGETGLLVEPDAPDELAAAVSGLLSDPDRAHAMGMAGRQRVLDDLNWSAVSSRIAQLVEDLP